MEAASVLRNCTRCKNLYTSVESIKRGRKLTRCLPCRAKYHCIHGKRKDVCQACSPNLLCEHETFKYQCRDCGSSAFCHHGVRKQYCKVCSHPIKRTIWQWMTSSRYGDKKKNRFDPDHFIDSDFLLGLIEDYRFCYYSDCKVELQFIQYTDNLASIERLNNKLGHIKSNCVLACLKCNKAKKSNLTSS